MKLLVSLGLMALLTYSAEAPIKEGYATTYYTRDDTSPGITYVATTLPGINLSDMYDPKKLAACIKAFPNPPKPFYIRVFADHITATNTATNTTESIATRNLVKIDWKK